MKPEIQLLANITTGHKASEHMKKVRRELTAGFATSLKAVEPMATGTIMNVHREKRKNN